MREACICSEYLKIPIVNGRDAPMGNDRDAILSSCDQLAISQDQYMAIYRCHVCGTVWVEACYDSGMVLYEYLYPAPPVEDPVRWFFEEAKELPKS